MTAHETPAELRARPLSAEAKAHLRYWVQQLPGTTPRHATLALLDEIDALLAELAALRARVEAVVTEVDAGLNEKTRFQFAPNVRLERIRLVASPPDTNGR